MSTGYFGVPGHCYSIDGDWWHEPGACRWCTSNPCCGVVEPVLCETHTYGSPSKPWELVIRCPAHGEPEPCLTCRGYIAAGL